LRVLIVFLIVLQLSACSSICLVPAKKESEHVEVYTVGHNANALWLEALESNLEQCDEVASDRYSQGNVLADFVPSPINSSPSCLLVKAKNHAVSQGGSLIVVEYYWHHFEAGLQYSVLTYKCPGDITLIEDPDFAGHSEPSAY